MKEEYGISSDDSDKLKDLTKEQAEEYLQRIREYTQKVMKQIGQMDPQTGRLMMR